MLEKVDYIDRKISGYIHNCVVRPQFLELLIFPFAFLFQPYMVPVLLASVGVFMPIIEEKQRVSRTEAGVPHPEDWEEGTYRSYVDKPASIMIHYLAQMLVMLVITLWTKKSFGRIRPSIPEPSRRMINLRSLENNCSFPSGDTAQSALLAFFIMYHFPYLFQALGEGSFLIKFIVMVAIGRVFHHCHFFGDTIFGASLGFLVATVFYAFELQMPVPPHWDTALSTYVKGGLTSPVGSNQ